jgi:hypothetical protein
VGYNCNSDNSEPLLNFSFVIENIGNVELILLLLLRIILAGFLCLIMSYRKYFFIRWIWYFIFHMLIRIISFLPILNESVIEKTRFITHTLTFTFEYIFSFRMDTIIFVIILVFAVLFEINILNTKTVHNTR